MENVYKVLNEVLNNVDSDVSYSFELMMDSSAFNGFFLCNDVVFEEDKNIIKFTDNVGFDHIADISGFDEETKSIILSFHRSPDMYYHIMNMSMAEECKRVEEVEDFCKTGRLYIYKITKEKVFQ